MGEGTSSRRRSLGPGHHRARHRATSPGHEYKARPVLRRWISLRTRGGESAEDGLQQRRIDGRRVEGLAGSGLANRQRLATSGRLSAQKFGWGGRIRTFTVLINSEVSYQLDHAPAGCLRPRLVQGRTVSGSSRRKKSAGCSSKIPRVRARRTRLSKIYNEQNKRYGPFRM